MFNVKTNIKINLRFFYLRFKKNVKYIKIKDIINILEKMDI